MTREEAIFCEKSYIGETNCTDCKYYGTETCQSRESHKMAIEALEQESVLDKIRAEIENHCGLAKDDYCNYCSRCSCMMGVREILELISKYKA